MRQGMRRETKFGYGFTLAGIGVPFLIDKLFGLSPAICVSVACVVVGGVFLVSGHRHKENPRPRKLWDWAAWGAATCTMIVMLSMGALRMANNRPKEQDQETKPTEHAPTASEIAKELEKTRPKDTPSTSRIESIPKLKAEIAQVADGHFIGNPDDNVMLAVRIFNTGEPTTVGGWDLRVYDTDGHEYKTQGIYLPAGHNNITSENAKFIQRWSGDDDLAQKLATNQIGKNKTEVGILAFQIIGVPLINEGFKLKLYCQDVTGKKYEAEHVVRGVQPTNLHVPGLSKP
jgi:hypothetical protein